MVTENTLHFRVDDHNRGTFKEAESFPPLDYEKKCSAIDLSFWRVPERLFDEAVVGQPRGRPTRFGRLGSFSRSCLVSSAGFLNRQRRHSR
jgi:hypothetical protein